MLAWAPRFCQLSRSVDWYIMGVSPTAMQRLVKLIALHSLLRVATDYSQHSVQPSRKCFLASQCRRRGHRSCCRLCRTILHQARSRSWLQRLRRQPIGLIRGWKGACRFSSKHSLCHDERESDRWSHLMGDALQGGATNVDTRPLSGTRPRNCMVLGFQDLVDKYDGDFPGSYLHTHGQANK